MHKGLHLFEEGFDQTFNHYAAHHTDSSSACQMIDLWHRRMAAFQQMKRVFPKLFKHHSSKTITCDACEMAKCTRVHFPSRNNESAQFRYFDNRFSVWTHTWHAFSSKGSPNTTLPHKSDMKSPTIPTARLEHRFQLLIFHFCRYSHKLSGIAIKCPESHYAS